MPTAEDFAASGARIRLCKGAYEEPASVAYRDRDEVTDSYLRCLRVLMAGTGYPMVASHDPEIIAAVPAMARENARSVDAFEYQMLYGIRDGEQRRLADEGNHVRVYCRSGHSGTAISCGAWPSAGEPDVLPAGAGRA